MKKNVSASDLPKLIILPEAEWRLIREDIAFLKEEFEKRENRSLGDWLSESQTQSLLNKKATSLWRLRINSIIISKKIGGSNYYNKQSIIDFLNSKEK